MATKWRSSPQHFQDAATIVERDVLQIEVRQLAWLEPTEEEERRSPARRIASQATSSL
jgi:hypothetical protein